MNDEFEGFDFVAETLMTNSIDNNIMNLNNLIMPNTSASSVFIVQK